MRTKCTTPPVSADPFSVSHMASVLHLNTPRGVTTTSPACPSMARRGLSGRRRLSCGASASSGGVDRRDVLLGLTAGGLSVPTLEALAASSSSCDVKSNPTQPFDFTAQDCFVCKPDADRKDCTPPYMPVTEKIISFSDLKPAAMVYVRLPAHKLGPEQVEKYRAGIQTMRDLPADHPHSLAYQASIHHTFCYGHYKRKALGDADNGKGKGVNVHFSWLFAPWHRMYIFFFERILRLYAGADFALPYWNWDKPDGMTLPDAFKEGSLKDEKRDPVHAVNCFVDLDYDPKRPCVPFTSSNSNSADAKIATKNNLSLMYNQMTGTAPLETFLGKEYYLGQETTPGGGNLEQMAHTAIHRWTGGDMGDFKTAAKDPIFYAHHANVDRLWHVWNNDSAGDANGSKGFDKKEWLDSTFLFHDEDLKLVKVKVSDVLDLSKLGYRYQQPEKPAWEDARSEKSEKPLDRPSKASASPFPQLFSFLQQPAAFPVTLTPEDGPVKVPVAVPRPREAMDGRGRGKKTEVLEVEGIEFDPSEFAKFDVCINVSPEDAVELGPRFSEFAGSFVNVPQAEKTGMPMTLTTSRQLVLDELLRDIGCAGDTNINVVLIPRSDQKIKIGNITIKLLD